MKGVFKFVPLTVAFSAFVIAGCHTDMWIQPKVKPQYESKFFNDKLGSRPSVPGAVAYGKPMLDREFYAGRKNGQLVREFPVPVTKALLLRGKERYEIFCTHCHGAAGDGQGMIAQRGFTLARPIPSYHTDRLRAMPVGHFFDVVTNGYGTMYPFSDRISPLDRWAIAAYIRVLQESQNVPAAELTPEARRKLEAGPAEATPALNPEHGGAKEAGQ